MKQKVVIRLSLNGNDKKYRTKAFKIAVSQSGVESAAITGDGKNQLEVVGEVDAVVLISLLRKNLGQADLVSVGPAGGDKNPAAAAPAPATAAAAVVQSQPGSYYYAYPSYQYPVCHQKVVIRLSLNGNNQKYRTKAFKIAVSQSGVESAAITGDGKNQLVVVGEVDAATLTSLLRKNLGQADLVSVGPAAGGPAAAMVQSQPGSYYYAYPSYQYPIYQVTDSYGESNCSIM
ncbi:hypothetical protein H5410_038651 [Solanum commersonii]|uniref:HMA domain-containing protein n=1 Tax=Solanum commersonii TaxID=4109 RepID=A0A9J5Y9L1_SOLCO|nr:hypothetical protein H5410_038651 [Solanum commersonii]